MQHVAAILNSLVNHRETNLHLMFDQGIVLLGHFNGNRSHELWLFLDVIRCSGCNDANSSYHQKYINIAKYIYKGIICQLLLITLAIVILIILRITSLK